jgi:hypothetical protein
VKNELTRFPRLMRVLLDTNVVLDTMLQRSPWHKEADAVLQAAALGQVTCATTTLSLATIFPTDFPPRSAATATS